LVEPPIVDIAKQEKEIEDKLARAVKGNDPKAVAEEAKNLLKQQEKLVSEAKNPAHQPTDPAIQKQVQNAVNDLNAIIPEQIKAANDLVNNPNDQKAQEKFEKLHNRAKDDLDDIIGAHQSNPLNDKAKRLADLRKEIDDVMKALKDKPNDPALKKKLADLTKELQDLTDEIEKDLNPTEDDKIAALINVENDNLDDVEKAMEAGMFIRLLVLFLCFVYALFIVFIHWFYLFVYLFYPCCLFICLFFYVLIILFIYFFPSSIVADPKKTDAALKDLEKTNKELVDQMKKAANNTSDPVKKDALNNAAKQLEKELPNLVKVCLFYLFYVD
jgi:hypothetical protein